MTRNIVTKKDVAEGKYPGYVPSRTIITKKDFMSNKSQGSYRTDYRDEDCMKFTSKDAEVLERLAREEAERAKVALADTSGN